RTLPSYMVPAVFMPLAALPLNTNGKVDRAALPAPARVETAREHVAPRTPTEETLVAVWKELFALPCVSVYDDFFELGGHALLATRLISRLRHRLGLELSARVVFFQPTLAAMAEEIDRVQAAGTPATAAVPRLTRRAQP
ncbi:MAG TPA: phosphopantetheine-binding protein, partial [Thermoanaerobaculia bacterium]